MNPLIWLAGLPWRGVNRARRALYRSGLLQPRRLPRPVISIGNLAAGGAGKTPAVIAICRELARRGLRVAVLTRGYGRADPGVTGLVSSLDALKYGDEPVLIKKNTNVDVIVGSNRVQNARDFLRDHDCDVFVLDDGFQHLQLHRDFDLVIDAPARIFREGRSALRDASAVVPRRIRTTVPGDLRGRRVFAFAGLADNGQFFRSLEEAGLELAGWRGFPDHHRYSPAEVDALRREAGGLPLVTSEKDAVKIAGEDIRTAGAEFVVGEDVLARIVEVASAPVRQERRRKRKKHPVVQRLEYVTYRWVSARVLAMSDTTVRQWGTRLGGAARQVLRGRDRMAMRNLRLVYPEKPHFELRRLLDACWRHFGREVLASIRTQSFAPGEILSHVEIVGSELVEKARARGNGVILLSAHWGSWEVAGLTVMTVVPRLRTVARALDNELLERDLQKMRERMGAEIIDRRRAARALLRGIADNGAVAMVPDQAVQAREGILVPFLRRPAWTTPAPAKLALRANAAIVFVSCIPVGLGYRLEFRDPIWTDELPPNERDPVALTRRINDVFSRWIDERPELWLWMHDRWKGTGEGGADASRQ